LAFCFIAVSQFLVGPAPFDLVQRADDGLEVGPAGRGPPFAVPKWIRQVQQRFGQLGFGQFAGVVDEDGGSGCHSDPFSRAGRVLRRNLRSGCGVNFLKQAGLLDDVHAWRVLGDEHIRRRRTALGDELVRHFQITSVADLDLDAVGFAEFVGPGLRQILVLRVVDDQCGGLQRRFAGRLLAGAGWRTRTGGTRRAAGADAEQPDDEGGTGQSHSKARGYWLFRD
jgi:hypothetical protein